MADTSGRRPHRTWPERLTITGTFLTALLCFAIAAALVASYLVVRQRNIAALENPAEVAAAARRQADEQRAATTASPSTVTTSTSTPSAGPQAPQAGPATTAGSPAATSPETAAPTQKTPPDGDATGDTFPEADPEARNFLITGADNGACIDPDSPYFGAFGDRETMGERSDTIMVLRVDPDSKRVAILSFPRDLYVEIAGSGNSSRINSAYRRDEPQRLADTIFDNFSVGIDHYIQVDFCAFKTLVDAVGGVTVPFEYPARDPNTGLEVLDTGCYTLDGDHALAYVRSRHYRYEDPPGSGDWKSDPSSDLGRISRQQDFLRRTLSSVLDQGPLNPRVVRGLIRAATRYVVTDRDLTPARMMEFAGVMNDVDPASIVTYQIEARSRNVGGASVLIPTIDGENMQLVLALFRGEISLEDAPVQEFEDTTTAAPRRATTTTTAAPATTAATDATATAATDAAAAPEATGSAAIDPADSIDGAEPSPPETMADTTLVGPTVVEVPEENQFGVVPPRDVEC